MSPDVRALTRELRERLDAIESAVTAAQLTLVALEDAAGILRPDGTRDDEPQGGDDV